MRQARELVAVRSGAGFRDDESHAERRPRAPARRVMTLVLAVLAALVAWTMLVVTLCVISEIAAAPTCAPRVESSTWTPLRGVAALVAGTDAFGGSFAPLPILGGLAGLASYALVLGIPGALALRWVLGPEPAPLAAIVAGAAYGLLLQACVVNLLINFVQAEPTVWDSLPSWGWWVANAAFGATLGLFTAPLLRGVHR
jgi:hypothetical protein